MSMRCAYCGSRYAPFGFIFAKRELWTCPEHRADGEKRLKEVVAGFLRREALADVGKPPEKAPGGSQGSLF